MTAYRLTTDAPLTAVRRALDAASIRYDIDRDREVIGSPPIGDRKPRVNSETISQREREGLTLPGTGMSSTVESNVRSDNDVTSKSNGGVKRLVQAIRTSWPTYAQMDAEQTALALAPYVRRVAELGGDPRGSLRKAVDYWTPGQSVYPDRISRGLHRYLVGWFDRECEKLRANPPARPQHDTTCTPEPEPEQRTPEQMRASAHKALDAWRGAAEGARALTLSFVVRACGDAGVDVPADVTEWAAEQQRLAVEREKALSASLDEERDHGQGSATEAAETCVSRVMEGMG